MFRAWCTAKVAEAAYQVCRAMEQLSGVWDDEGQGFYTRGRAYASMRDAAIALAAAAADAISEE